MATPRTLIKALTAVDRSTKQNDSKTKKESPKSLIKEFSKSEQTEATTPRSLETTRKQDPSTTQVSPFKNITPESDPRNQRFSIATPTTNVDSINRSGKTRSQAATPSNRASIASIKTPNSLAFNMPDSPTANQVVSPSTPPTQLFTIATPILSSKSIVKDSTISSVKSTIASTASTTSAPISPVVAPSSPFTSSISQDDPILADSPVQDSPSIHSSSPSPSPSSPVNTHPSLSPAFHLSQSPADPSPSISIKSISTVSNNPTINNNNTNNTTTTNTNTTSNTPITKSSKQKEITTNSNNPPKEKMKQSNILSFLSNRIINPPSISDSSNDQEFDIVKHRKQLLVLKPKTIEYSGISLPFVPSASTSTSLDSLPRKKGILKKSKKNDGGISNILETSSLPNYPSSISKKLFSQFAKYPISKSSNDFLNEASQKFFQQMVHDLYEISDHAGRKSIDAADVAFLFKRQRMIKDEQGLVDLIRTHLPLELIEEVIPVAKANNNLVPSSSFISSRRKFRSKKSKDQSQSQQQQERKEEREVKEAKEVSKKRKETEKGEKQQKTKTIKKKKN